MSVEEEIESLVAKFEVLSRNEIPEHTCDKLYCTTCGGLAGQLRRNLDRKTKSQIEAILNSATRWETHKFGFWNEFIRQNYSTKCLEITAKEQASYREALDMDSPSDVDYYLFDARRLFNIQDADYCSLLNRGIELALESKDVSLIETLILVLKEEANYHPDLIDLAIRKSKTNENIQRALYNKLRHVREDVRDYVGDGYTVDPLAW